MHDAPKLHGFTFTHAPSPYIAYWEPQMLTHTLVEGVSVPVNKGYILKGMLSWGDQGWVDSDELSNIAVMFNQMTGTAHFYPRPDTYSGRKFCVRIVGGFDFTPHGNQLDTGKQKFQGTIKFESSIGDMTATASDIF